MNIYVVRHGQTDWNKKGILQGNTDRSLNEEGIRQASQLKFNLKDINFEYVISSDLKRAFETAKIINSSRIVKNIELRERNYGKLEGTTPENIREFWDISTNISDFSVEPIRDFLNRIFTQMDNIIKKYEKVENLLIVTHYGVVMAIDAYFNNKYEYCFDNFDFKNCEYKKYEI